SSGADTAILANAASFALAALALTRVRLPRAEVGEGSAASLLGELRDGWHEVRTRTWLWVVIGAFGIANAIHAGAWAVLGPLIADASPGLGARGWGFVVSAEAVGAIAMTLLLLWVPLSRPVRQGMIGVALMVVPLSMLGIHPETLALCGAAFIAGAG